MSRHLGTMEKLSVCAYKTRLKRLLIYFVNEFQNLFAAVKYVVGKRKRSLYLQFGKRIPQTGNRSMDIF